MNRFEGNVAVVTGAASGIGRAVGQRFLQEGASVALVDIQPAGDADHGPTSLSSVHRCDVSDSTQVTNLFAEIIERHGTVDILVNAAGIVRYGQLPDLTDDDWAAVIGVNLTGVFYTTRAAIPVMKRNGGGAVVNVASNQAFASQPLVSAYAASKGALVAMTRTVALDHAADGIRVNAVAPGSVRTAMLQQAADLFSPDDPEGAIREWGETHAIGRVIEPEEVASVVAFLASAEADCVTGTTYLCDGGLSIKLGG